MVNNLARLLDLPQWVERAREEERGEDYKIHNTRKILKLFYLASQDQPNQGDEVGRDKDRREAGNEACQRKINPI